MDIRSKLTTDVNFATSAMVAIFKVNQTSDERADERTKWNNGIGFNGCDAEILSSFSRQVLHGRTMSPKQQVIITKKLPKYAKQVEQLINSGNITL